MKTRKVFAKTTEGNFFVKYANHQCICCDFFSKHAGKRISKGLREITVEMVKRYHKVTLIPGKKWWTLVGEQQKIYMRKVNQFKGHLKRVTKTMTMCHLTHHF